MESAKLVGIGWLDGFPSLGCSATEQGAKPVREAL